MMWSKTIESLELSASGFPSAPQRNTYVVVLCWKYAYSLLVMTSQINGHGRYQNSQWVARVEVIKQYKA